MPSGARPSNAGDRYHFVYVVRRLIDMLRPQAKLHLVHMESSTLETSSERQNPAALLGVDHVEYVGGRTVESAATITIVQVKYSPLRPQTNWTVSRLVRSRSRSGLSILRKLAQSFDALYAQRGHDATGLRLRLVTNQPLQPRLLGAMSAAQDQIRDLSDQQAGDVLERARQPDIVKLQIGTNLDWTRFAALIRSWDLSSFSHAMLNQAESQLFVPIDQLTSQGSQSLQRLIAFVQERATTNQDARITPSDVRAVMGLREIDFWPAPAKLESAKDYLVTADAERLRDQLRTETGSIVLLHGDAGKGKTSCLQLIGRDCREDFQLLIYDCFGAGEGMSPGRERFPVEKCFTQIINELDACLGTGVLATTRLAYDHLMEQFYDAIRLASAKVAAARKRLVIAFDAVDNARAAAHLGPLEKDAFFLRYVLRAASHIPDNCTILLTARTENVGLLELPDTITSVVAGGFTESESVAYLSGRMEDAPSALLREMHRRTRGTPRTLTDLARIMQERKPDDRMAFVKRYARETAFKSYAAECKERLGDSADVRLLAVCRESRQPAMIEVMARVVSRDVGEVKRCIEKLAFGIRIEAGGALRWRNEDFWSFAGKFAKTEREWARDALAKYCREEFGCDDYARANYSWHAFVAERWEELVGWWMEEGRLAEDVGEGRGEGEVLLEDIRYCLAAAGKVGAQGAVVELLSYGADLIQRRDVFLELVREHVDVAVAENFESPLLEALRRREGDAGTGIHILEVAHAMARQGKGERLKELLREGIELAQRRGGGRSRGLPRAALGSLVGIESERRGIREALEILDSVRPRVHEEFASVARDATTRAGRGIVEEIMTAQLEPDATCFALLGYLSAIGTRGDSEAAVGEAVAAVMSGIESGAEPGAAYQGSLGLAVEELLREGYTEEATSLARYWEVPTPRDAWDPRIEDFLACDVLRDVLGLPRADSDSDKEGSSAPREPDSRLAALAAVLRPALECRARAWISGCVPDFEASLDTCLRAWRAHGKRTTSFGAAKIFALLAESMVATSQSLSDVRVLLDRAKEELTLAGWPYLLLTSTFVRRDDYHVLAEEVILAALRVARPPTMSGQDAADLLLRLHPIAAKFDQALATELFSTARLLAGDLDWTAQYRSAAVLALCRRGVADGHGQPAQLSRMMEVMEYLQQVEIGEPQIDLGEALALSAQVDPVLAFGQAAHWEREAILDARRAAVHLGNGLLEADVDPMLIWPLAELTDDPLGTSLIQTAIERMDHSPSRDAAVTAYVSRVVQPWNDGRRIAAIRDMKRWATSLELVAHEAVDQAVRFAAWMETISGDERNDAAPWDRSLSEPALSSLPESARAALDVLKGLEPRTLRDISTEELTPIIDRLSTALPSSAIPEILNVVETWSNDRIPEATLSLIGLIARSATTDAAKTAVCSTLKTILTGRALRWLPTPYEPRAWETLRSISPLSDAELFAMIASKLSETLPYLSEAALHQWIARLSELLAGKVASQAADDLLRVIAGRIPTENRPVSAVDRLGRSPPRSSVEFLVNLLGHPRQNTRWRAAYALVAMIHASPTDLGRSCVDELASEGHGRWLTRREWLLFVLHHVALTEPTHIAVHLPSIAKVALDKALPHAKLRYHAKEIVTYVEEKIPGSVDRSTLDRVRRVNEPQAVVHRGELVPGGIPYEKPRWATRKDGVFQFDPVDTMPYWFSPMAHCFGMHRCHIAERAYRWIVNVWGLSDEACWREEEQDAHRYDWRETSNDHGAEPAVETLRKYAERHGMYLAAGELIDTEPVVGEADWPRSKWEERMRYERGADPALPSRLLSLPPLVRENFGRFATTVEEWQPSPERTVFRRQILADSNGRDWFVLAGDWEGSFHDRRFGVAISSALVPENTARSLVDVLRSSERHNLPEIDLSHAGILQEVEIDATLIPQDGAEDEQLGEGRDSRFRLRPVAIQWYQELPFHEFDPKWPSLARRLHLLAPDVAETLGVTRQPLGSSWMDSTGKLLACFEAWHERAQYGEDGTGAKGNRLLLRREALSELAARTGCDVVVTVWIQRNKASRHRTAEEQYDLGSREVFLLSDFTE